MEAILEYASSPSPPSSPLEAATRGLVETTAPLSAPATAPDSTKKRQLHAAQGIINRSRSFGHRSTQEEDTFAFRAYAAKRRRRRPTEPAESPQSGAIADVPSSEEVHQSPLYSRDDIVVDSAISSARGVKKQPLCKQQRRRFVGHTKAVNAVQWHPLRPELFLSASMDATVRIWNSSTSANSGCQRVLKHHSLGVKSAKWSHDGKVVLSGGYDGRACCVDAETGQVLQELRQLDISLSSRRVERITVVSYHPTDWNAVLFGTDQGRIYGHDLRMKNPEREIVVYTKSFGDVHDLLFVGSNGQQFVSSAGVLQRDASNQTLLVWDWRSSTMLYDRLDSDMMAHSCLRAHPTRSIFVAQCSGNYASLFSSLAPYKCLKGSSVDGRRPPLRFEGGHEVEGYGIQCSFSPDGTLLASGDANGRVVLYRTLGSRKVEESLQLYGRNIPCICAEFRPSLMGRLDSVLLTGSGTGDVDMFQ